MKILSISILSFIMLMSCNQTKKDETRLSGFIDKHLTLIETKQKAMNLAYWNATATGEKKFYDEYAALDLEIKKIRSDKTDFAFLKELKESNTIKDTLLLRQLILLYNAYVENQIDTSLIKLMVEKESAIANRFNTFRGKIDGKQVSDNEILNILRSKKNPVKRKKAWEASKQVGKEIAAEVIELVKLRNRAAKQLGFDNYYVMSLATDEQDAGEIISIFDQLKQLTDEYFGKLKKELDDGIARRYGITLKELRPWHYEDPFFQEVPVQGGIDFDKFFKDKNITELGKNFYNGIGLAVDDILNNSDLYPREGKYQHAYATDIDRKGDVRTMCSIVNNSYWMETLLHELGHCVYSKYVNRELPYLLRSEAHSFLTEAIAMLMGRQSDNADWLQTTVNLSQKEKEEVQKFVGEKLRLKVLIFSRWAQVMVRFEKSMYENPDQDLNRLWWDLVEEYQLVTRPEKRNEPDWAAKIHLSQYPCYYHNYVLGDLAASQILNSLVKNVLKQETLTEVSFAGKPEIGKYLKEKIFIPGSKLYWNDLLKYATGEGLTPKYFAEQFVKNSEE